MCGTLGLDVEPLPILCLWWRLSGLPPDTLQKVPRRGLALWALVRLSTLEALSPDISFRGILQVIPADG